MKITTKAVFDIETGECLWWDGYHYIGEVEECKRGQAKDLATNLMNWAQGQASNLTAQQLQTLAPLRSYLTQFFANPYGFTPAQQSSLLSQAKAGTANQFLGAENQLKQQIAARGDGGMVPQSGISNNQFGQFSAQQAQAQAGAAQNVQIANAQQMLQNLMGFGGLTNQAAGVLNPAPYVGGAASALGTRGALETAPTIGAGILGNNLTGSFSRGGATIGG